MKKQPYHEIMDLYTELKEYKKLCKCKSKKFCNYFDWKSHIIKIISELKKREQLENFKHFIINRLRINKDMNKDFTNIMIFLLGLYIGSYDIQYSYITLIIILVIILFMLMNMIDDRNKEYFFYYDLVKIIDETEKSEGEIICYTTNQLTKKQ